MEITVKLKSKLWTIPTEVTFEGVGLQAEPFVCPTRALSAEALSDILEEFREAVFRNVNKDDPRSAEGSVEEVTNPDLDKESLTNPNNPGRWESGFRSIVVALWGSRTEFDIPNVVLEVRERLHRLEELEK